jgi:hypothetical protein
LVSPEGSYPIATCPLQFPLEIDSIPWDEVGHRTRYEEIKKLKESKEVEGIEFRD